MALKRADSVLDVKCFWVFLGRRTAWIRIAKHTKSQNNSHDFNLKKRLAGLMKTMATTLKRFTMDVIMVMLAIATMSLISPILTIKFALDIKIKMVLTSPSMGSPLVMKVSLES